MTRTAIPGRPPVQPWLAVLGGVIVGGVAAFGVLAFLGAWSSRAARPAVPPRPPAPPVVLFAAELPGDRAVVLLPAGPDAKGEPALARRLLGTVGDAVASRLATFLAVHRGRSGDWEVDLAAEPLRVQGARDAEWQQVVPVAGLGEAVDLPPAVALRLRALGGTRSTLSLRPGTAGRVLIALPEDMQVGDLSGVQWGAAVLTRREVTLRELRALREDAAWLPRAMAGAASHDKTPDDANDAPTRPR